MNEEYFMIGDQVAHFDDNYVQIFLIVVGGDDRCDYR